MFIRFHIPPKVGCLRSGLWTLGSLSPKERFYYDRSKQRYIDNNDANRVSMCLGVIGTYAGFSFFKSGVKKGSKDE